MSAKNENQADQENGKAQAASSDGAHLPVMLDILFDFSNLILLLVPLVVAAVSYMSGATWLDVAIRAGVTLVVIGVLLLIITQTIARASIDVTNSMLETAVEVESQINQQG